jgi:hypothetical protein
MRQVSEAHRIVEDSTMDARRFRDHSRSETLARCRYLGWVLLMMFVLVQTAAGMVSTAGRFDGDEAVGSPLLRATADFNPETHQVTVKAYAPPAAWDFTTQIGRHSFVVYEDKVRQLVDDVEAVHTPLSIGVLLENGGRYHALNAAVAENVSRAARALLDATDPDDTVTMWTYGSGVQPLEFSGRGGPGLQRDYVSLPVPTSSESNFYDALLATLPRVQQMPGRSALLVVSSGVDSFSHADFADVLRAEAETGVPICVINIGALLRSRLLDDGSDGGQPYSTLQWQQASSRLSHLAEVSGCRSVTPSSSFELPAVYDEWLANLRLQYVVQYRSTPLGLPRTRHVTIEWGNGNGRQAALAHDARQIGHARTFAQAQYEWVQSSTHSG